jgi:hypothetical protein
MASQPSALVLAGGRILHSKRLGILLSLIAGALIGYQASRLALALLVFGGVALIAWLCLLKTNWAIWLLIFVSPFHFVVKALSSSGLVDVWREVFFLLIFGAWLLQVLVGKRRLPRISLLNLLIAGYLLWGIVAILNSANLLVGLAGFRFMFSFVPLFFVAHSTIADERDVKRFVGAILASGVVVAVIAILQFILVSVLGLVEQGTSIDFARKFAGSAKATGIPWERANSVLVSPNELGVFLSVCLTLGFSYYWSVDRRNRHPWLLRLLLAVLGMGLLASMSRSSMAGLAVALLVLGLVKRRGGPVFVLVVSAILVLAVVGLYVEAQFQSVYTLSDPYFSNTWKETLSSTMLGRLSLLGQGYGLTPSVAEKLGIDDSSVLMLGGIDIYFVQSILQIGLIGFSLFFLGWLLFVRDAYLGARRPNSSEFMHDTAAGMCAAFLAIMVTSLHVAAWEYVSFAATYYLLGAIASWSLGETGLASKAPRTGAEGDTGSRAALARSSG